MHPQLLGVLEALERVDDGRPDGLVHHAERHHEGHDAGWGTLQEPACRQPRHEELPLGEHLGERVPVLLQHGLLLVLVKAPLLPVIVSHFLVELREGPVEILADVCGDVRRRRLKENHGRPQRAEPPAELHGPLGLAVREDRGRGRRLPAQALQHEALDGVARGHGHGLPRLIIAKRDLEVCPDLPLLPVLLLLLDLGRLLLPLRRRLLSAGQLLALLLCNSRLDVLLSNGELLVPLLCSWASHLAGLLAV
mmetsp:Transcript_6745/g.19063  ORF Transcript_6745/g.19063 Transcript_6745/m.19063 type:complete len:251 (-) Transcript_6745:203-955(-)